MSDTAKRSPLHGLHIEHGAKLVEFAGYEMPVRYTGIVQECKAVRQSCGWFDVSHMARLNIGGGEAEAFLGRVTTNAVSELRPGQGHYTLLPNAQGGTVDDAVLYCTEPGEYTLVVNAANHAKDVEHLVSHLSPGVRLDDVTEDTAMLALQGPDAESVLQDHAEHMEALAGLGLFDNARMQIGGCDCFVARSGYTGEDGFELVFNRGDLPVTLLRRETIAWCGLGARDALRVEAGLPLYGHELSEELSPICAGLGWVIADREFIGSDRILADRANGTERRILGFKLEGRRVAEPGAAVLIDGQQLGAVTSGVYSPTLGCGIGFALMDSAVKTNTPCQVEVRGSREPGMVVGRRFIKRKA